MILKVFEIDVYFLHYIVIMLLPFQLIASYTVFK